MPGEDLPAFDVYGCRVLSPANDVDLARALHDAFGYFSTRLANERDAEIDFEITSDELPVKPYRGQTWGLGLQLSAPSEQVTIRYNPGVPPYVVAGWTDFLLHWPDRRRVHASGVTIEERALVFAGARRSGKTDLALGLLGRGGCLLGDDWVFVGDDGRAYPYPHKVRIMDHHLARSHELSRTCFGGRATITRAWMRARLRLRSFGRFVPHRLARYWFDAALGKPVLEVDVTHLGARPATPAPLQTVFWLDRGDHPRLAIESLSMTEMVQRLHHNYQYERGDYYRWVDLQASLGALVPPGWMRADEVRAMGWLSDSLSEASTFRVRIPTRASSEELADLVLAQL